MTGYPWVHSPEVARHVAMAARAERAEEDEAAERAEEWLARAWTGAYAVHAANQAMLAAAQGEARRAELAEQREREARLEQAEGRRMQLIMAGARPHTVAETLATAAGQVP